MDTIENTFDDGNNDNAFFYQNIRNRCGEIYFENDKLKYYCLFCQEDFGKITTFINHLYRSHLFMDPPLLDQDEISQLLVENNDCVKTDDNDIKCDIESINNKDCVNTDDIKCDVDKSYIIEQSQENNVFCNLENNEYNKFVTKLDIVEDDRISINSKFVNDVYGLNEEKGNLFIEYKAEVKENETEENTKCDTIEFKKNQCKICLKILSSESSLKKHNMTHQKINDTESNLVNKCSYPRGEDNKFHCNLCTSTYARIDSLRRHIKKHLGTTNLAQCGICSKILSSKNLLKNHMRVHTGERPYKCNHCPAAFADRTNFDRHLRIHLGDKRYNCDYCDKTFIQSSEKKIHERMVHTKERPYQCEICGQKFFKSVTLNDHKKRHTNTKPCECEVCGKRFYNKELLNDHKISHSNEKPYTCDICSAKFPRRKALREHVKLHSNVKEYACRICSKAFAQISGLYSHMKSHTGNPQTPNNITVYI